MTTAAASATPLTVAEAQFKTFFDTIQRQGPFQTGSHSLVDFPLHLPLQNFPGRREFTCSVPEFVQTAKKFVANSTDLPGELVKTLIHVSTTAEFIFKYDPHSSFYHVFEQPIGQINFCYSRWQDGGTPVASLLPLRYDDPYGPSGAPLIHSLVFYEEPKSTFNYLQYFPDALNLEDSEGYPPLMRLVEQGRCNQLSSLCYPPFLDQDSYPQEVREAVCQGVNAEDLETNNILSEVILHDREPHYVETLLLAGFEPNTGDSCHEVAQCYDILSRVDKPNTMAIMRYLLRSEVVKVIEKPFEDDDQDWFELCLTSQTFCEQPGAGDVVVSFVKRLYDPQDSEKGPILKRLAQNSSLSPDDQQLVIEAIEDNLDHIRRRTGYSSN